MEVTLKARVIDFLIDPEEDDKINCDIVVNDYSDEYDKFIKITVHNEVFKVETELTESQALFLAESIISIVKNSKKW